MSDNGILLLENKKLGMAVLKKVMDGISYILVHRGSVTTTFTIDEFLEYLENLNSVKDLIHVE